MEKKQSSYIRLHYLDGLRGLAALYVVMHHAYNEIFLQGGLSSSVVFATKFLTNGRIAVATFIVLSGYCLMLPVCRSENGRLRGGLLDYLRRRARRIIPPYYAALVLSLLLIGVTQGWNLTLPAFKPEILISHFLLLHNLHPDWRFQINYPMWSIATEWQIYFFFPVLLLPVWRQYGIVAVVLAAFAVGYAPHFLLNGYLDWAVPWYLGLFGMGMAAAAIGFAKKPSLILRRKQIPWGVLSAGFILMLLTLFQLSPIGFSDKHPVIIDPLIGTAVACLLISCTNFLTDRSDDPHLPILRLLDSRWVVGLGAFSYSLYLTHAPFLTLIHRFLDRWQMSATWKLAIMQAIAVPICAIIAYVFHLFFERQFILSQLFQRNGTNAAQQPAMLENLKPMTGRDEGTPQ